jgi:hypothetical protein
VKESREEGKSTSEITQKEIPGVLYPSKGVVLINVHMKIYSRNSKTNYYYTKYYPNEQAKFHVTPVFNLFFDMLRRNDILL